MESSNRITIDEKGFIKNLLRLGFTKNQSFSEILTNSIDAKSTKIIIKKNKNEIRIIDNGIGMNAIELKNKYNLMKQRKRDRDKHDHLINDAQMAWAMNDSLDNGGATEEQVLMDDYISKIKIMLLEAKTKLNKEKYELLINYNYNLN